MPNMQKIDTVKLLQLLEEREDSLRRYIARKIPTRFSHVLSTDDILQETWISAYRSLFQFRPTGPDAFDRWLTSIANHRLLDAIRTVKRLKRGGNKGAFVAGGIAESSFLGLCSIVASAQPTPSAEVATAETAVAVRQALHDLPKDRRDAIGMRYIEGRSISEIAGAMAKTKSAVHSLLFHGLRQLRERIGHASKFFSDAPSSTSCSAAGENGE